MNGGGGGGGFLNHLPLLFCKSVYSLHIASKHFLVHVVANTFYVIGEAMKQVYYVKLVLHNVIFLATCLATLGKIIHFRLQETYFTLQSWAATCNGFKKSLQSLQEVESNSTVQLVLYGAIFLPT